MTLNLFSQFSGEVQDRLIEQAVRGLGSVAFGTAMGWWRTFEHGVILQEIDKNVAKCQSPIEAYMGVELGFLAWNPILYRAGEGSKKIVQSWFTPQWKVGAYKLDFAVRLYVDDMTADIAVECDGHDFHERTKEQARHDRSRDRALLTKGYVTLRFTGSEIYQSPADCADQIAEYLATLVPSLASKVAA